MAFFLPRVFGICIRAGYSIVEKFPYRGLAAVPCNIDKKEKLIYKYI